MRTQSLRALLLIAAAFLLVSPGLFAAGTGSLIVKIVDQEGLAVPGVSVTISSPVMMGTKTEATGVDGEFHFQRLVPGLYLVESVMQGFGSSTSKDVRVSIDVAQVLEVSLSAAMGEQITVSGTAKTIDTTQSGVYDHVQPEVVEALPVGRDYVAYMQLVSGVNLVANAQGADTPEDPAGKGGLNYSDRGLQRAGGGKNGSRDNLYYIDGVNITDATSQIGGIKFNNEVIQEQEIITSGIPAEYSGGKGVVANIVTKSGGNNFSGSANFYVQPKALVGGFTTDDERLHVPPDTKYDTAATIGGPMVKDRAWFFGSVQRVDFANDVELSSTATANPGDTLPYDQERNNFFGKVTASPTGNGVDQLAGSFFWAGQDISGTRDPNILPDRRSVTATDYNMFNVSYQRTLPSNWIIEARYGHYGWDNQQLPINPSAGPLNNVLYLAPTPPAYERQFGGASTAVDDAQKRDMFQGEFEWLSGDHDVKGGVMYALEQDQDQQFYPNGYVQQSLAPGYQNMTLKEVVDGKLFSKSEVEIQLLNWLNSHPDGTSAALDLNKNGKVELAELYSVKFGSMNDHGLDFTKTEDSARGANNVKANRWSVFLQDDYRFHPRVTLNAGLRMDNNEYIDSTGGTIAHLDTAFLPRIGMSWDLTGDGRNKLSSFYGQFLDPLSFDMVHFAGNISGRVRNEQMFLNNAFYTYRQRGSAEFRDAVFVPNIEDSRAHEFNVTFERDFGKGLVGSVQGFWRKDTNIIEDYDLSLYLGGMPPGYEQLNLTLEDFGYGDEAPTANFFLANLIGAERRYIGLDFEARKNFTGGHLLVGQYSWKDTEGNSQSDNNADLQGDFYELDPRNPWMLGTIPGTIDHQVKMYGTYRAPYGIDLGGMFYWNHGTAFTDSNIFIPGTYNIYTNRPLNETSTQFAQTGAMKNPSYYQVDAKVSYKINLGSAASLQLFLDIYNLTNNQGFIELMAGDNDQLFDQQFEPTRQLSPRRAFLGASVSF